VDFVNWLLDLSSISRTMLGPNMDTILKNHYISSQ